jgi:membrane protease YdiL (CAAX protease family)
VSARRFIWALSDRAEFWLVVILAFGYFIVGSVQAFVQHRQGVRTDAWAAWLVLFEIAILAIIAWIAHVRGWSLLSLGVRVTWPLTGAGLLLYVVAIVTVGIVYVLVASAVPGGVPAAAVGSAKLSWTAVIVVSIVNSFYEEVLVAGYIVTATSRHGMLFAVTASALIRFLYHTYQGPIAAICILPIGILFAMVYARSAELWPLIVAHGLMDLQALGRMSRML